MFRNSNASSLSSGGAGAQAVLAEPASAPATFTDSLPLPKLVVFDLDYTLWPFWCDTHVSPPLKAKDNHTRAVDRSGESFAFYTDVPSILHGARCAGIRLGLASRTSATDIANELLRLLYVPEPSSSASSGSLSSSGARKAIDFFPQRQIFPGDKRTHLDRLAKGTGLKGEDILFFDDESRNRNVESLGVTFWLVDDGVTRDEVDNGVREWRRRRGVGAG